VSDELSPERRPLLIVHDISVRTYDTDSLGHVNNVAYVRWMEDMRFRLFDAHFPYEGFIKSGVSPVIASTHIEYRLPVGLFDKPRCFMWMSEVGNTSFKLESEIVVGGTVTTAVAHVGVFVDLKSGRPVAVPLHVVDKFRAECQG